LTQTHVCSLLLSSCADDDLGDLAGVIHAQLRSDSAPPPIEAGDGWGNDGGCDGYTGMDAWRGDSFGASEASLGDNWVSSAAGQGQGGGLVREDAGGGGAGKGNDSLQSRDATLEQAALAALGLDDSDEEEEVQRPGGGRVVGGAPAVPGYSHGVAYNGAHALGVEEQAKRWPEDDADEEEDADQEDEAMLNLLLG